MIRAAASALAKDLPGLTRRAIEQVHDPEILSDPGLEASLEILVDRLCLSLQLSKPVGLATWAVRESGRSNAGVARSLFQAAAFAIAGVAASAKANPLEMLNALDELKVEMDAALAPRSKRAPDHEIEPESAQALIALLAEADALTCCHSKATAEWTRRLCEALQLPKERTDFIVLCALLHDIGKVTTPEHILKKAGPLSADEWTIMRDHAAAGQRIVSRIPSLANCALVIRAHHESFDGSGYPDGLAGDAIPFEARVVAVSDSFHAMISDRPYRQALSPRRALEILSEGAGKQWDPIIVAAMLRTLRHTQPNRSTKLSSTA